MNSDQELATSASSKSLWTLSASSNYDQTNLQLSSIIDGNRVGTVLDSTIYATKSSESSEDKHPWIQINLGESKVVKGVHMYRYRSEFWAMSKTVVNYKTN